MICFQTAVQLRRLLLVYLWFWYLKMTHFSLSEKEWRQFCYLMKKMLCNIQLSEEEISLILEKAQLAFQDEGTLLEFDAPVSICGDIH
ncbi:phosphoprotein phosphatase 1, partial [Trichinella spiralis]